MRWYGHQSYTIYLWKLHYSEFENQMNIGEMLVVCTRSETDNFVLLPFDLLFFYYFEQLFVFKVQCASKLDENHTWF